mgnify:CR=1 FL=1
MRLSAHFTLKEFTDSDTALRLGIDNILPDVLLHEAEATADMLERIRAYLGDCAGHEVRIDITSGYRCAALNTAVGSKPTSDHIKALAADFKAPVFGTALEVCKALAPAVDVLGIGQLIHEHAWIHVSRRRPEKDSNRLLTVNGSGYVPGIMEA